MTKQTLNAALIVLCSILSLQFLATNSAVSPSSTTHSNPRQSTAGTTRRQRRTATEQQISGSDEDLAHHINAHHHEPGSMHFDNVTLPTGCNGDGVDADLDDHVDCTNIATITTTNTEIKPSAVTKIGKNSIAKPSFAAMGDGENMTNAPTISASPTASFSPTKPRKPTKATKTAKAFKGPSKENGGKGSKGATIPNGGSLLSWFKNDDGDLRCEYQVPTKKRQLVGRGRRQDHFVLEPREITTSPKPSPVNGQDSPKQRRLNVTIAEPPAKNVDPVESIDELQENPLSENMPEEPALTSDPNESPVPSIIAVDTDTPIIDEDSSIKSSKSKKKSFKSTGEGIDLELLEGDGNTSYTKIELACPDDFEPEAFINPIIPVIPTGATDCDFGYFPDTAFGVNDVTLEVQHPYKLSVFESIVDGGLNAAIVELEGIMNKAIIADLQTSCTTDRRRALEITHGFEGHHRRQLTTIFSSIGPTPSDLKTDDSCIVKGSASNTKCVAIDANSTVTYSNTTEFASKSEITLRIQKVIKKGCSDGSFVKALDTDAVVEKCVFIATELNDLGGQEGRAGVGSLNEVKPTDKIDRNMTVGGAAILTAFFGGVILIALMAARRQKEIIAKEFVEMEEGDVHKDDLVGKYGLDLSEEASTSLDSAAIPPQLVQFVDNDDDESRLSSPDQNAFANGGTYNPHGTHVHNCTSATCDICAAKEGHRLDPTFIGTYDMYTAQQDTDAAIVDDTVEF